MCVWGGGGGGGGGNHRYPVSNNCVINLKQKGWTLNATEELNMA